jgi:hypothetical protein
MKVVLEFGKKMLQPVTQAALKGPSVQSKPVKAISSRSQASAGGDVRSSRTDLFRDALAPRRAIKVYIASIKLIEAAENGLPRSLRWPRARKLR